MTGQPPAPPNAIIGPLLCCHNPPSPSTALTRCDEHTSQDWKYGDIHPQCVSPPVSRFHSHYKPKHPAFSSPPAVTSKDTRHTWYASREGGGGGNKSGLGLELDSSSQGDPLHCHGYGGGVVVVAVVHGDILGRCHAPRRGEIGLTTSRITRLRTRRCRELGVHCGGGE